MAAIVGIVASFVGPAIELGKYIVVPVRRQFSYFCCFNSHIQSLRDEAEKLENARAGLQRQVDVAERKAEDILKGVQDWLKDANEIQVNKRGIEIEIQNVESGCLNIISRYSLSKKAKKTTDAMKKLQDGNKFDIISWPAPPAATAMIPLGPTCEFESRKHIEKEIMEALESNKVNIIGICGMGGVGKTTMAQRIRNRVREKHLFDEAVMTVVGQEVDRLKVLHEISDQLGLPEAKTLPSGAHHLHNRLKGKNKILIVVDDIWKAFQLEDLGIPCQDGVERHHKVLLTSRDKGVLNAMGAQKVCEIETLDERDARLLFTEKSGICSDDFNLLPIAENILKECSGLPIALTTVGSALKGEKVEGVWKCVLQQLKDANPVDVPGVLDGVYKPLKASYDLLDSPHARSFFLLCSLFPEDSDISLKDLTLYCMGLQIFQGIRNLEQARNTVLSVVGILKRRFLLLEGKYPHLKHHHVRMHDVVRDVAKFIASREGLVDVNLQLGGHHSYSECKWVSFFPQAGSQLPSTMRLNFPSLRILMMECVSRLGLEIEDFSFLEGMKELSVLSLKSISFKSVPQTMQLLKNLRTLHLQSGTLETISVVGELLSLEILCFRHCGSIKELPTEIGRLKRLKLLEFSDCTELKAVPPGVLSNLIELEEFTMVQSFNKWELAEAKEKEIMNVNASLHELQSLRNLTCLNIEIEDCTLAAKEMPFLSKIVKYHIKLGTSRFMRNERPGTLRFMRNERPSEKKMHLNLPRGIAIGNWIRTFATTTEELHLSGDGSNILHLLQAPNVKSLRLEGCSTVKKLMDATSIDQWTFDALYLSNLPNLEEICDVPIAQESNSFKNLEELNLEKLPALKHLWNNPNQIVSLSNLSSITVWECDRLCSLAIAMDSLSQLQDLTIASCSMMEQVFSSKRDGKKSRIAFPQLKILQLFNLKNLTTFCQEVGSIEFPMLTWIEISNCPGITSLVSSIENNQNSASIHLFSNQEESNSFKNLKRLNLEKLPALKHLWNNPNQIVSLSNLSTIIIGECGLRSLAIAMDSLSQLRFLKIESCSMMEQLFSSRRDGKKSRITFPQLESLKFSNLENLTTFCQEVGSIEFPMLTKIDISNCPRITSLVSSIENNQNSASTHLFCSQEESNSFKNLKQLSLYKLPALKHLWNNPNEMVSLSNLSHLSIWNCGLGSLAIAMDSLPRLQDLWIGSCSMMEQVFSSKRDGKKSHITFPQLKGLQLSDLESLTTFCQEVGSIEFPMLTKIDISNCPRITSLVSSIENNQNSVSTHLFCSQEVTIGSLKELKIGGYNNTSKIWCHQIPDSFFTRLTNLKIVECNSIRSLFSSAIARNLINLTDLTIERCKELVKVIEDEEEITGETNCLLSSLFPRLKDLTLDSLPRLESFCEWRCDLELPMLANLSICECPEMKVFTMGSLISAHKLERTKCPKLKSIEPPMGPDGNDDDTFHLFCSRTLTSGSLERIIIIGGYNNISKIWCHQIPNSFFTGLKGLAIVQCDSIRSLFSSATARNLVNLKGLAIENCKEMVKVIDDEEEKTGETSCPLLLFPRLKYLTLDSLPKLGSFCEWRCVIELPKLKHVTINGCPMMKVFTMGSLIITPNLGNFEVEDQETDVGDLNELVKLHCYTKGGDKGRPEIVE